MNKKDLAYIIIGIILFILTLSSSLGLVNNVTEFDDGCAACNITANETKYLTLPINASIEEANVSIKGIFLNQLQSALLSEYVLSTNRYLGSISAGDLNNDSLPDIIIGTSNNGQAHGFINNGSYTFVRNLSWDVTADCTVSGSIGDPELIDLDNDGDLDIAVTGCAKAGVTNYDPMKMYQNNGTVNSPIFIYNPAWSITTTLIDDYIDYDLAFADADNDGDYDVFIGTEGSGFKAYNNTGSTSSPTWERETDWDFSSQTGAFYIAHRSDFNFDGIDDITVYYTGGGSTKVFYAGLGNGTFSDVSSQYNYGMSAVADFNADGLNDEIFYDDSSQDPYTDINSFSSQYPKNVLIKVNETYVFNHTNNLTGTNSSINLNLNNALESCNNYETTCPITFSASSFGQLEIFDFFIQYNKTNFAILDIISPTQITASVTTGSSYTATNINITNTGTYNATNISFVTVSGLGSPNYNDSISFTCSDTTIQNGNSILCNVTFSSLTQEPESDEKLKIQTIGSDNNDIITSPGIDIDITITAAPAGGGQSGGGGSTPQPTKEAEFLIVGERAYNEQTNQLGIRPSDTRQNFCLDIVNTGTDTQIIDITCKNPEGSAKDVCSWFTMTCKSDNCIEQNKLEVELTVQPSLETRETFCMDITTPADITINEKYVVNIQGNSNKGTQQTHTITLQVFSASLLLQNIFSKFTDTNIMDGIILFIQQYIKEDVRVFSLPNMFNPVVYLPIIFLFLLFRRYKLNGLYRVIIYIILTIYILYSLFNPSFLYWINIILGLLYLWSILVKRVLRRT